MIAVLSVALLTLYVDNFRTRGCIANYMVADQRSSSTRVALTDQERAQFKLTLQVLVSGEADSKKRQTAITSYIDLLDKNDHIREQNPVQPVPTECS
jgi:hypothetical protein